MGREHKSNNVYWTVNLEGMFMFQRCFDCREFVSSYFELPAGLVQKITPKLDSIFSRINNEEISEERRRQSLDDSLFSIDPEEVSRNIDDDIQIIPKKTKVLMDSFNDPEYEEKIIQLLNNEEKKENTVKPKIIVNLLKKPEKRKRLILKNDECGKKILVDLTDEVPEKNNFKKNEVEKTQKLKPKIFLSSKRNVETKSPERKMKEITHFIKSTPKRVENSSTPSRIMKIKPSPEIL